MAAAKQVALYGSPFPYKFLTERKLMTYEEIMQAAREATESENAPSAANDGRSAPTVSQLTASIGDVAARNFASGARSGSTWTP